MSLFAFFWEYEVSEPKLWLVLSKLLRNEWRLNGIFPIISEGFFRLFFLLLFNSLELKNSAKKRKEAKRVKNKMVSKWQRKLRKNLSTIIYKVYSMNSQRSPKINCGLRLNDFWKRTWHKVPLCKSKLSLD